MKERFTQQPYAIYHHRLTQQGTKIPLKSFKQKLEVNLNITDTISENEHPDEYFAFNLDNKSLEGHSLNQNQTLGSQIDDDSLEQSGFHKVLSSKFKNKNNTSSPSVIDQNQTQTFSKVRSPNVIQYVDENDIIKESIEDLLRSSIVKQNDSNNNLGMNNRRIVMTKGEAAASLKLITMPTDFDSSFKNVRSGQASALSLTQSSFQRKLINNSKLNNKQLSPPQKIDSTSKEKIDHYNTALQDNHIYIQQHTLKNNNYMQPSNQLGQTSYQRFYSIPITQMHSPSQSLEPQNSFKTMSSNLKYIKTIKNRLLIPKKKQNYVELRKQAKERQSQEITPENHMTQEFASSSLLSNMKFNSTVQDFLKTGLKKGSILEQQQLPERNLIQVVKEETLGSIPDLSDRTTNNFGLLKDKKISDPDQIIVVNHNQANKQKANNITSSFSYKVIPNSKAYQDLFRRQKAQHQGGSHYQSSQKTVLKSSYFQSTVIPSPANKRYASTSHLGKRLTNQGITTTGGTATLTNQYTTSGTMRPNTSSGIGVVPDSQTFSTQLAQVIHSLKQSTQVENKVVPFVKQQKVVSKSISKDKVPDLNNRRLQPLDKDQAIMNLKNMKMNLRKILMKQNIVNSEGCEQNSGTGFGPKDQSTQIVLVTEECQSKPLYNIERSKTRNFSTQINEQLPPLQNKKARKKARQQETLKEQKLKKQKAQSQTLLGFKSSWIENNDIGYYQFNKQSNDKNTNNPDDKIFKEKLGDIFKDYIVTLKTQKIEDKINHGRLFIKH